MGASPHFGREIMWGPVPTRQSSSNALQGHYSTPLGKQAPVTPAQVPVHSTLCSTFLATGTNLSKSSVSWV